MSLRGYINRVESYRKRTNPKYQKKDYANVFIYNHEPFWDDCIEPYENPTYLLIFLDYNNYHMEILVERTIREEYRQTIIEVQNMRISVKVSKEKALKIAQDIEKLDGVEGIRLYYSS